MRTWTMAQRRRQSQIMREYWSIPEHRIAQSIRKQGKKNPAASAYWARRRMVAMMVQSLLEVLNEDYLLVPKQGTMR